MALECRGRANLELGSGVLPRILEAAGWRWTWRVWRRADSIGVDLRGHDGLDERCAGESKIKGAERILVGLMALVF